MGISDLGFVWWIFKKGGISHGENVRVELSRVGVRILCRITDKSLRAAVMICAILVNTQTHRLTDTQLPTGYIIIISSASLAKNW